MILFIDKKTYYIIFVSKYLNPDYNKLYTNAKQRETSVCKEVRIVRYLFLYNQLLYFYINLLFNYYMCRIGKHKQQ